MEDFRPGDIVRIDKKGSARVINWTQDNQINVEIIGIDYQIELSPRRLSKIPSTVTSATEIGQEYQQGHEGEVDGDAEPRISRARGRSPEINEWREIYHIQPEDLNRHLCKFFVSVRKPNGENYEPGSLRSMLSSIERYLKKHGYGHSVITDLSFYTLRETIKSKQKALKRDGKGNLPNKSEPPTDQEIDHLWITGQLGSHSPNSIINSLWFFTTVHFGLRGDTEHRNMCWGDVTLRSDNNGREYLEFTERQTKTRTGINPRDIRQVKPKMWDVPQNTERCPIHIYKKYSSLRPSDFSNDEDPFYIATNTRENPNPGEQWFRKQAIGKNKIGSIMKKMAEKAQLSINKKLTNSSARKRLLQKLNDENIPTTQIMQISGHRNIQSVNSYSSISEDQHRKISGILNSTPASQIQLSAPRNIPENNSAQPNHVLSSSSQSTSRVIATSSSSSSEMAPIFGGPISGGVFIVHVHYHHEAPQATTCLCNRIVFRIFPRTLVDTLISRSKLCEF